METVRVQIRLTPEALQRLDNLAARSGLNRSAMLRLLIMQATADGAGTTTRPIEDH